MSSPKDLIALRKTLLNQRKDLTKAIASLDRIIERAQKTLSFNDSATAIRLPGGVEADVRDMAIYGTDNIDIDTLDFTVDDVVTESEFLRSLLSEEAENNISLIWTDGMRRVLQSAFDRPEGESLAFDIDCRSIAEIREEEHALQMASGQHPQYGATILSLASEKEQKIIDLSVIFNKQSGNALIVGETEITDPERNILRARGVHYVSRQDKDAVAAVKDAFRQVVSLSDEDKTTQHLLSKALGWRGYNPDGLAKEIPAGLLARFEPFYHRYVVKRKPAL